MADTYNNKQIDMINGCWYYTEDHASVKELNSEIFKEQCRVANIEEVYIDGQ